MAIKYSDQVIDGFIPIFSYETNLIYLVGLIIHSRSIEEVFEQLTMNANLIDTWVLTDSTYTYIKVLSTFEKAEKYINMFLSSDKEFVIRYGYLFLFNYVKIQI